MTTSATKLLLLPLLLCAATLYPGCSALSTPAAAQQAPPFTLPSLSGGEVSSTEYRGKVVLLHFWATWCDSCREELPSLSALAGWLGDRKFAVIAIAVDSKPQAVREFVGDIHGPIVFLVDSDAELRSSYALKALPATYIIGKNGKFLERIEGPRDWTDPANRQQLRDLARSYWPAADIMP